MKDTKDSIDTFDPFALEHRKDPDRVYGEARQGCPVMHVTSTEPSYFAATRADDVKAIIKNMALWRSGAGGGLGYDNRKHFLSQMDDMPVHDRRKVAVVPYFLPRTMHAFRPRVEEIARELFDAFYPKGSGDFVHEVAFVFPVGVVAALLGAPAEDRDFFKEVSTACMRALNGGAEERKLANEADASLEAYIETKIDDILARHGEDPDLEAEDLLTHMVLVWQRTGKLDRWECNKFARNMLSGGHESTTAFVSLLMRRLIDSPEIADRLRAEPERIPIFIEEVLRYECPVQGVFRTNRQPTTLRGRNIPLESKMQILFASANRDPGLFDEPDRFSIDRDLSQLRWKNLAFGFGIHHCLGAPLARMEGEIAVEHMLRLENPCLTAEPEFIDAFILRGYKSLPIAWTGVRKG